MNILQVMLKYIKPLQSDPNCVVRNINSSIGSHEFRYQH